MPLEIIHREREGIEIVDLIGHLTFGEGDLCFRNDIDKMVRTGKVRLVLNLKHLVEMDAIGLGTILYATARFRLKKGNVVLLNLHPAHLDLLVVAKLETVLDVFEDEQEAVNSFFPGRRPKRYDVLEFVRSKVQK